MNTHHENKKNASFTTCCMQFTLLAYKGQEKRERSGSHPTSRKYSCRNRSNSCIFWPSAHGLKPSKVFKSSFPRTWDGKTLRLTQWLKLKFCSLVLRRGCVTLFGSRFNSTKSTRKLWEYDHIVVEPKNYLQGLGEIPMS